MISTLSSSDQIFMARLKKTPIFSFLKYNRFRSEKKTFSGIFKKVRTTVSSTFLSFCLLCTFSMGNMARANSGTSSQSKTVASQIKSKVTASGRKVTEAALKNSDIHHGKVSRKVSIDIVIAQGTPGGAIIKKTEKKSVSLAKQINRKSREVEKSLSNDLFEFEKEAEQEVKQSWDSLTGSMKGERSDDLTFYSLIIIIRNYYH